MTVRHAQPSDARALAAFGRRVFHDTFAPDNNPADLSVYLDGAYNEARQLSEIEDAATDTLLVEADGALAAFAQVRTGTTPKCVTGPRPIELWRFYVDHAWHGKGVAVPLMEAVEDVARTRGAETVWLGVWELNPRARAFYRKCGFVEVGTHTFVVGTDRQTDLVMIKLVARASEVR